MQKYDLQYHRKPHRSLDETLAGPILRLCSAVLGTLVLIALIVFLFIPGAVRLFGGTLTRGEPEETLPPTPSPTLAPTPEPIWTGKTHSIESRALSNLAMLDASIYGDRILYVAGENPAAPDRLYAYDIESGVSTRLSATCKRGTLRSPVENADYLLYADVTEDGAGDIHLRNKATGEDAVLCSVRYGAPKLALAGRYLAYKARTGVNTAELYLVDLITKSGVAAARFTGTLYGASDASFFAGALVYAEPNEQGASRLVTVRPSSGEITKTDLSGLAYDPARGSGFTAYLDGPYGENASLYVLLDGEKSAGVAYGVAAFSVSGAYVVYQSGGEIYAYHPKSSASFPLTNGEGNSRLVAVGGGYALWLEGETYQWMRLEHDNGEG